jgi:hypothetical protein
LVRPAGILEAMADFAFSQPERRSFVVPALIAAAVLAGVFALVISLTPHRIADITVTHVAILPTHTVFKAETNLVGAGPSAQDELYVLATVRVEDKLNLPLFIKDITGTLTTADGEETSSAVEKKDLDNMYVTFPKLVPLSSAPLVRETAIQPGGHAEGMVLLHFETDQATWDQRKAATVTIPKP